MSQPTVSILVPAFRAQWLDLAIASALGQTHADFELLVSDDSPGDDVAALMAKWDDPRLRYFRNPRVGQPGSNRDHLLAQARGDYLKFLFDDDFLYPRSVELLLQAARATGAPLAFHARHLVDSQGRVLASPSLVKTGETALLRPDFIFEHLVGGCANPIGEPSNILVRADALRALGSPFAVAGRRQRFLTDVSLYANLAASGQAIAGVGHFGSAFRQHAAQTSGTRHPAYSAGHFEWELLRRWAAEAGLLASAQFEAGRAPQNARYRQWVATCPELQAFIDLDGATERGSYLGPAFREALALADTTIEMRKLAALH